MGEPAASRAGGSETAAPGRPRVVLVGAGFAGLAAARGLARADVALTVVDRANHHLFQPLLYQVATAGLSPGDIASPIRGILGRQKNTTVLMGEVVAVDALRREVQLRSGDRLPYDVLLMAPGTRHSYFGHDEWAPFAPGLKTLADALAMRETMLTAYERAERAAAEHEFSPAYLTFVIVGGGPTGVELAGAIAEIGRQTMARDFRHIDPRRTRVLLVEALPEILPQFPPKLGAEARRELGELGVEVWVGRKVETVDAEGVVVDGERVRAATVLWAAGNQASPVLATLPGERDRAGRVIVGPDCAIPGHPEIFVLGDAANHPGPDGKPLPGLAPNALQQGRYVAKILRRRLPPGERPPFRYLDKGSLATIGRARAVGMIGRLQLHGFIAWLGWSFIHILYLIGFRNRYVVLTEWIYWYLSGRRGVRLIQRPLD